MTTWVQSGFDWDELAIAWGLTLSLTLMVAAVMRRPLYAILKTICGTDMAARFWTAYSTVMLVVGPLFLVSLGSFGSPSLADFVRRTTMLISFGQIVTVAIMGIAVRVCSPRTVQHSARTELGSPSLQEAPAE
jgi:hypothetical protein